MKRWLILELVILFGVTAWIYFFPDEAEVNFAKGLLGFALIYFIETFRNAANDEKKVPKKGTSEEKDKMFKTNLDWVSAYKKLEEENEELKNQISFLKDNLRVARKDREDLQLEVAKGLKQFVTDFPATAIRYLANEKYVEDNEDLKQSLDWANEREKEYVKRIAVLEEANAALIKRIKRAKRCMKKLMFIINSDPANYNCKGLMQDAEDFINNRICNIRQLGEHCISETRCIMCDMEDKDD